MKKILAVLLACLLFTGPVWAVSSVSQVMKCFNGGNVCRLTLTVDAHTDGSVTSVALTSSKLDTVRGYYLYEFENDNGTAAPQDNWGFTITDSRSLDILGGAGANRHTTTAQRAAPLNTAAAAYPPIIGDDVYTLNVSGNNVNGADMIIRLWFKK